MSTKRTRHRRAGAALLLIALILPAACREDSGDGEVVLYTSIPDPVVDRLVAVIERRLPDLEGNYWVPLGGPITLTVVRGRTGDLERRIARELEAGDIQADLIWLAEPSPYEEYKKTGVLARYDPPAGAPIPSRYLDPDGFYVAGRVISMVIAWNTSLRSEPLTDWPDLLDVETTAFPGPESGAARATIMALIGRYGRGFFTTLADHGGVSVADNEAARDGVVAGTFEAVAVLDYMARRAKGLGSPIDFVYPSGGTVLIPSPIAVTADAANPGAAEVVVDFILSRAGQEIVVEIGDFYPVRTDVEPPPGAPSLTSIPALEVDWNELAVESGAIGAFWADLFEQPPQGN